MQIVTSFTDEVEAYCRKLFNLVDGEKPRSVKVQILIIDNEDGFKVNIYRRDLPITMKMAWDKAWRKGFIIGAALMIVIDGFIFWWSK